jgi:HlyD family secretion protein
MRRYPLLFPLPLLGLAACSPASGNGGSSPYPYRVGLADRGEIRVTIEETGVVEPERQIVVKSPISGVVLRLSVREGDAVRAGQLLATVVPDIAQANALAQLRSDVTAARISRDNAKREYDRAQGLTVGTMITPSALEERRAALEQAENTLRRVQDQLRLVEQSGVSAGSDSAQVAAIRAPAAGVVIVRGVEEGETVVGGTSAFGGGTEMFTIGDLSVLVVKAAVNEVDIGKVSRGDRVWLTVDAVPDDTVQGVVRLVPPAARQQERVRVFDVEVEVLGRQSILRPGMTANVRIAGPTRRDVVRAPVEAVFFEEGKPIVHLVRGGQTHQTPVILGLSDLSHVEIRSGVQPGDSLALEDPAAALERERNPARRR